MKIFPPVFGKYSQYSKKDKVATIVFWSVVVLFFIFVIFGDWFLG